MYRNIETERFQVETWNTWELYAPIRDYVADCLRRVPNMTPQTLGVNIKLATRTWVAQARAGEPVRNLGWGPTGELDVRPSTLLALADHVGDLSALDETAIGESWRELADDPDGMAR